MADDDLYVYSDEDIERIVGELYAQVRELEDVDESTAEQISTMTYDIATGDWTTQD
jgi:hypothetical protein